jgi:hypothetical protein
MRIPLTVQVESGLRLQAETTCVSKHGASIRITGGEPLACGDSVQVSLRSGSGGQAPSARVVWVDKAGARLLAIELEQATDFWGIRFPGTADEQWRPAPRPEPQPGATETPAEVAKCGTPSSNSPSAPAVALCPPLNAPPAAPTPPREQGEIAAIRTATITGLNAVHTILAENVQVFFTGPGEAQVFLCSLVEPGTRVRLFLTKDQAVLARVVSIGDKREAGKWRVRIRCEPR